MPNYTCYGNGSSYPSAGTTQSITGAGLSCYGPPQGGHPMEQCQQPTNLGAHGTTHFRWRGLYVKQSATEYRWVQDERISDTGTQPTTWAAL